MLLKYVFLVLVVIASSGYSEARDFSFNRKNYHQKRTMQPKVKQLKNKIVTKPVEVQGTTVTVVSGVRAYNRKKIERDSGAAMLTIMCPRSGGRVIVRNSSFTNSGLINSDNGKAGITITSCSNRSLKLHSNNNSYSNSGVISVGKP